MRRTLLIAAGALVIAAGSGYAWLAYEPQRPTMTIAPSGKLLLTGVTVVDPRDGRLSPDMDVLTERGRIMAVATGGTLIGTTGAQRVDARGKFVVPGYNDYHAHPLGVADPSGTLALMLANGITGFRQMQGSPRMLEERAQGRLPTGRYAPAALVIPGTILTPFNAGSPDEARATVDEQKSQGADFIKVGLAAPDAFLAAEAEARKVGLPFVGHLQAGVDAAVASKLGMRAMEHLGPGDTELVSCSTDEAALRRAIATRPVMKAPPIKFPMMDKLFAGYIQRKIVNPAADADAVDVGRFDRIVATFSEQKCRALAATFVANGTWQVPTLVRMRTTELGDLPEYASDPNLRYMPPDIIASWRDATARFAKNQSVATKATFRNAYALQLRLTKLYDDAGVRMLAGSDESGQWEVSGFSLHQEFDELADAGLSPLRILQMTTVNGAEFLGRTKIMGLVAPGMNADLVLLDANPLVDVRNMHRIVGVVRAGYYYSRNDLDAILARVHRGGGYLQ